MIKGFFVVIVTLHPGSDIANLLINQMYVVFIVDTIVIGGIIHLGIWTYRSFGIGAMSVIRRANDDVIKDAFL